MKTNFLEKTLKNKNFILFNEDEDTEFKRTGFFNDDVKGFIQHYNLDLPTMVYIDRLDCFNKYGDCIIQLKYPKTQKELKFILKKIKWLKTSKAYKISNQFKFNKFIKEYK